MTVTHNRSEILSRANQFAKEFADARYEMGEAQNFIRGLCDVFGFSSKRLVSFEHRVRKLDGRRGRIDGFYPGKLLIEMKSRGEDLAEAYRQATQYLPGLPDEELPAYFLVSDFENLHLYKLSEHSPPLQHKLPDFSKYIDSYLFLAGYETQAQKEQIAVNESAARKIAELHDAMRASGYAGVDLQRYLVRLLFCLFAEDTGIFERRGDFSRYIREYTRVDGSDLDGALQHLFDVLNRAPDDRPPTLPQELQTFPYINGSVFDGQLQPCYFVASARKILLDCAETFDWSHISPAIFGSLFQAVIHHDNEGVTAASSKRRELGAHYTSETNILRVIGPLFLDELKARLHEACAQGGSKAKLQTLLARLRRLNLLDPACGCGNFLVIAYREIRRLELDAVEALQAIDRRNRDVSYTLDAKQFDYIQCDVHQFHGIEIEASAAHIATVALWLTDHQENLRASRILGGNFNRLPLARRANIVCANALTIDWGSVLLPELCDYVVGNPPFIGAKFLSDAQRVDVGLVFHDVHNAGLLDFVAAWYVKAARYLSDAAARTGQTPGAHEPAAPKSRPTPTPYAPQRQRAVSVRTRCAFVSTNSITQGEQVGVLWGWMLAQGMKIQFAHRTFQWSNDAKGVAAVHCVIIGFGTDDLQGKVIFDYPDIKGPPVARAAKNINPYLVDAPDVALPRRSKPICDVPEIGIGNKPIDGGHYLFTTVERDAFLRREPAAAKFFRRWLGSEEFLNGFERWCLWLGEAAPGELRALPEVLKRIDAVRAVRLESKSPPTRKLADTPTRFHVENMPKLPYMVLPETSSERREYVPFGYVGPETLCSNAVKLMPEATLFEFGVLSSLMHNAWVRMVCGRLKSDLRYSKDIVYNNFPWPALSADTPKPDKKRLAIEVAAQQVLDARATHPSATLADLYDPLTMPANLRKAHQHLDKAVDATYAYKGPPDDASRVAFLFGLYERKRATLSK